MFDTLIQHKWHENHSCLLMPHQVSENNSSYERWNLCNVLEDANLASVNLNRLTVTFESESVWWSVKDRAVTLFVPLLSHCHSWQCYYCPPVHELVSGSGQMPTVAVSTGLSSCCTNVPNQNANSKLVSLTYWLTIIMTHLQKISKQLSWKCFVKGILQYM